MNVYKMLSVFRSLGKTYTIQKADLHLSCTKNQANIINGKEIAKNILAEIKVAISKFNATGNRVPHLTAVLVGNNPASESYVKIKLKAAAKVGISSDAIRCEEQISEKKLLEKIRELNRNPEVDGILVQLPLPSHITERNICNAVTPEKDVDGFNIENVGRLCLNMDAMIPCTALAVEHIIQHTGIKTLGKSAVVCGRSKNVGMPIALLLHSQGGEKIRKARCGLDATTTICHRYTPKEELTRLIRSADIVVSCAGIPKLITGDMIKEGACVIDVGMTRLVNEDTKKATFVGDIDFIEAVKRAGFITPVPGGVGPVTVAMLMKNTFKAAKMQVGRESPQQAIAS